MNNKKKYALVCTSIGQVINTKSAIDYLNIDAVETYIIIIHPILTSDAKKKIIELGKKFKFKSVIDISNEIKIYQDLEKKSSLKDKIFNNKKIIENKIKNYKKIRNWINKKISEEIGELDYFFLRSNYKHIDMLAVDTHKKVKFYSIEDGHYDYIPSYWMFLQINTYEIKVILINLIKRITNRIFLFFVKTDLNLLNKIFFIPKIVFKNRFTNIETKYSICVGDYFINNLKIINKTKHHLINQKVIIIGTTIDKNYQYNIEDEVQAYNRAIDYIKNNYKLQNKDILYVPHPRIKKDEIQFKMKNLKCKIMYSNKLFNIDSLFLNKNVILTMSFGSTSLYYSHKIFNIKSLFIYERNLKKHPSSFESHRFMARRYNLETVDL